MPTVLTEAPHAGEYLVSEAAGFRSRETGTLAESQTIVAGQVLGRLIDVTLAGVGAAGSGNTGEATITADPAVAAGTPAGIYTLTAVSAGATAVFLMEGPDGVALGEATTGTPATIAGIGPFTITDAGVDPAIGDQFTITVTATADEANDQLVAFDQDGTDGSQNAVAIAFAAAETASSETKLITYTARDAEVSGHELTWPDDIDADEKAAAIVSLAALGIIVRT